MKKYRRGYMEEDEYRAACTEYPEFIYWKDGKYVEYKYAQKYLHEATPEHNNMLGMYYKVIEISHNGGEFTPITSDERYHLFGTSELDVYLDGEVGFIWNGHFNHLGYLEGDQVVEGR